MGPGPLAVCYEAAQQDEELAGVSGGTEPSELPHLALLQCLLEKECMPVCLLWGKCNPE